MGTDVRVRGRLHRSIEKLQPSRLEKLLKEVNGDIEVAKKHSTSSPATVAYTRGLEQTRDVIQRVINTKAECS